MVDANVYKMRERLTLLQKELFGADSDDVEDVQAVAEGRSDFTRDPSAVSIRNEIDDLVVEKNSPIE